MLVSIHLLLLAKHARTLNRMLFKNIYTYDYIKIRLKHLQVRQVVFAHATAKQEKYCELIHVFLT